MRAERIEGKIKPMWLFRFLKFFLYWNFNNSFSRVCKKFHRNLFLILHLCHVLKIIPSMLLYLLDWKTEYVRITVSDNLGKSLKNIITKSDRAQFLPTLYRKSKLRVMKLFTRSASAVLDHDLGKFCTVIHTVTVITAIHSISHCNSHKWSVKCALITNSIFKIYQIITCAIPEISP